jgi:hypothetical protein
LCGAPSGVSTPWSSTTRDHQHLKSFAGALARNSDRIEVILASLERLGGSGSSKQTVTLYELAAPAMLALDNAPPEQLTVSEPTAVSGVVDDLGWEAVSGVGGASCLSLQASSVECLV